MLTLKAYEINSSILPKIVKMGLNHRYTSWLISGINIDINFYDVIHLYVILYST